MLAESQAEDLVYQLAVSGPWGRHPPMACFAARASGLYISHNAGQTWESAYRTLNLTEPLPTLCVALSPNFKRAPRVFAGYNGGVLRSEDGGQTWTNLAFPAPPPAVVALTLSPSYAKDGLLFAGTLQDGVLYFSDRSAHWMTGNFGLIDMNVLCLALSPDFETDRTIYAGTQSGLFCSQNAGRSWREVTLPMGYEAVISLALSPHFAGDGTLFVGTESQGLLCSADRGAQWRSIGQSVLSNSINQILLSPDFPRRSQLCVLQEGDLFASEDGGLTWRRWQETVLEDKVVTALLAPRGFESGAPVLVGLEDGQVIRTRA
jgi:photosystem II stability/assembly factor-like uncharacterized protein